MINCFSSERQAVVVQPRSASTNAEEVLLSKLPCCTVSAKILDYFDGVFAQLNNTASVFLEESYESVQPDFSQRWSRSLERPPRPAAVTGLTRAKANFT